jgi:hypothetical protein
MQGLCTALRGANMAVGGVKEVEDDIHWDSSTTGTIKMVVGWVNFPMIYSPKKFSQASLLISLKYFLNRTVKFCLELCIFYREVQYCRDA